MSWEGAPPAPPPSGGVFVLPAMAGLSDRRRAPHERRIVRVGRCPVRGPQRGGTMPPSVLPLTAAVARLAAEFSAGHSATPARVACAGFGTAGRDQKISLCRIKCSSRSVIKYVGNYEVTAKICGKIDKPSDDHAWEPSIR